MKLFLITLVVVILPQITRSTPAPNTTMTGSTSQQGSTNKTEIQRRERGPSPIPCPVAPQARDTHLNNLAKLEYHSTTCPEGGAIIQKQSEEKSPSY